MPELTNNGKCVRCGGCCLASPCFAINKEKFIIIESIKVHVCPHLSFDDDLACCAIYSKVANKHGTCTSSHLRSYYEKYLKTKTSLCLTLINKFLKQPKAALIGTIAVPPRVQEDWQNDIENSEIDLSTAITLPVVVFKQYLQSSLAEKEELDLESAILDKLQYVNVNDSFVIIDKLFRIELNRVQQEFFYPLWHKQKLLCVEFRIYLNFDSNLLFSIGGLWDGSTNSWMFDPHSKLSEFWKITMKS